MPQQVSGFFRTHDDHHHPDASLAPFVIVELGDTELPSRIAFLIDTGADFTTLGPRDAFKLLGDPYLSIDFDALAGSIESIGVGQGGGRAIRSPMELRFRSNDGDHITIVLPVAISEPVPTQPGLHGNWLMPSLLGRDVLQHFDLRLSYHPQSVVLEEASASD